MGLSIGIVGLPNVGKSTLFNAITKAGAPAANYPFCTIDPNIGVVEVPDPHLFKLAELVKPKKVVPATTSFVDIAGLVRGASKGEGLGNKFLAHIRDVDAVAHVVRCFEGDVTHVEGNIDPQRDIETVNLELILADLETVEKRWEKTARAARIGDKKAAVEFGLLQRLKAAFDAEKPARSIGAVSDEEAPVLRELHLLTAKPVMYVANTDEATIADPWAHPLVQRVKAIADAEGAVVVPVCAQIEAELAELDDAERAEFLAGLGLTESGLDRVIHTGFRLLGLMTFYTAGEPEVRAWTIRRGTRAPQAAGVIHTDIERGFIRAEVTSYDDIIAHGGMHPAREKGLMRLEGKEYVMQEGDVVYFRFNV